MVTYLVYAPISFFFDSVATISLKVRFFIVVTLCSYLLKMLFIVVRILLCCCGLAFTCWVFCECKFLGKFKNLGSLMMRNL